MTTPPFLRGDNGEIVTKHWRNLEIFFSKTIWTISTKLKNASLGKRIQVSWKERPCPFSRGNNNIILKIRWWNFEIFSRTTGPISTNFGTKHLWVKSQFFQSVIIFFSLNLCYGMIIPVRKTFLEWNCFPTERCGPWASCSDKW